MKTTLHYSKKVMVLLIFSLLLSGFVKAQWSNVVNISPNATSAGLNESMGSCIGTSGNSVHVVWSDRYNSTHGVIYYTHSLDSGLTWSTAVPVSNVNGNAWNSAIAVNGDNIHVVWRSIDTISNHRSSWYNHSIDGGNTWGTSMIIDSSVADWPAVAVSGNNVYVANDIVTTAAPYNTEIFFLKSLDNGNTWSAHQQITFSVGRSEDEAITAQGSDIFMSWNDNRSGSMQIFYKHSGNNGLSWDSDLVINPEKSYGTMGSINGANLDIVSAGAPAGHYQIHINQSADTGNTWGTDTDLTQDTANTYYYPAMVRDGMDLHLTYVKSGAGAQYLHSMDGGSTWENPVSMGNSSITPFVAYTGCVVHIIVPDSGRINYFRNPTGNMGTHCIMATKNSTVNSIDNTIKIYPNPVADILNIKLNNTSINELKLINALGETIIDKTIATNKEQINLDVKLLPTGIYLLQIIAADKITTEKIIKQ